MVSSIGNDLHATRCGSRFKLPEVKRLLRAAQGAGLQVYGYEVDPVTGTLSVNTSGAAQLPPRAALDQWKASHADSN